MLLAALLGACAAPQPQPKPAPTERIVLLPGEDGPPSAVIVTRRDGRAVELKQPYAAVRVSREVIAAETSSAADVRSRYATLLSVQPPRVRSYTLYFEFNRAVLTPESQRDVERVLAEAAVTPAAEIDVIGHTDSRGAAHFNDLLGSVRARRVARMMEERGFDRSRLSVQSRGEREPVVQTPDNTDEPRNRRVEIRLR